MPLYPPGFIEPCLPTVSRIVPTGPQWAFEIKHDGFRFILPVANGEKRTNDEPAADESDHPSATLAASS